MLEREDYLQTFEVIEAGLDRDGQERTVWMHMRTAARLLDQPTAGRYEALCDDAAGTGIWHQLQRAVRSKTTVPRGLAKIVQYQARVEPHPDWKLLNELPIDEDLARLHEWITAAFTDDPPPDNAPGIWFDLVNLDRDGALTLDMRLDAGQLDDHRPDDLVIGGSWTPRNRYAHSAVLDELVRICHAGKRTPLTDFGWTISLAYAGLAIRWVATHIDPELMLGEAPQRVLAVGHHDGDSIGIGTLRPTGLTFPKP